MNSKASGLISKRVSGMYFERLRGRKSKALDDMINDPMIVELLNGKTYGGALDEYYYNGGGIVALYDCKLLDNGPTWVDHDIFTKYEGKLMRDPMPDFGLDEIKDIFVLSGKFRDKLNLEDALQLYIDPSFMEEVEHLIMTLAPMYGSRKRDSSFFDEAVLHLEEVMTLLDIDSKLFSQSSSVKPWQYETRETRVLKALLARTLDYALEGPLCKKHVALAKRVRPGDLVLSFNYDILIDDALYNDGKLTDSGYGMSFFKTNEDGTWIRPNETPSDVALLKLHGSLNWTRCGQCGALVLYRYKKQVQYGAIMFQCPRCSSDDSYAQRMMIPPIQSKEYSDRDIGFLWVQADRMMREISRIVCVGYSFPHTDFDMLSLMRRFRARQTEIPEIDFVSPDLGAESRLKDILGATEVDHFENLSTYLNSKRVPKSF